jgi:hypothetical protein
MILDMTCLVCGKLVATCLPDDATVEQLAYQTRRLIAELVPHDRTHLSFQAHLDQTPGDRFQVRDDRFWQLQPTE